MSFWSKAIPQPMPTVIRLKLGDIAANVVFKDIKNLHLIYHLLRQRKYTIEGAKDFLKKNKKAEERFEAIQRLQEIRAFLQEWKGQMDF